MHIESQDTGEMGVIRNSISYFCYLLRASSSTSPSPSFKVATTSHCAFSSTALPPNFDYNIEMHLPCIIIPVWILTNPILTYLLRSSHFRTPSLQSLIRSHSSLSASSSPLRNSDVPVPASEAWLAVKAALFKYV